MRRMPDRLSAASVAHPWPHPTIDEPRLQLINNEKLWSIANPTRDGKARLTEQSPLKWTESFEVKPSGFPNPEGRLYDVHRYPPHSFSILTHAV
jgi:hypothetical protein